MPLFKGVSWQLIQIDTDDRIVREY